MIPRAAFLALALCSGLVLAAEGFEEEPFQVTGALAPAQAPAGGEVALTVSFKLRPDVHLYKDKITFQWSELKGLAEQEVVKPKGKAIPDLLSGTPGATLEAYEGSADVRVRFRVTGSPGERAVIKGTVGYQGCTETMCFRPQKAELSFEAPIVAGGGSPAPPSAVAAGGSLGWGEVLERLLEAFLAGLGISLTPCVYPMIPITMAVIGGRRERTRGQAIAFSLVYVLGIALTYSVLGFVVASAGASVRLALQSPWFLVPVAVVFLLLALSMFDVLTIKAPGSLDALRDRAAAGARGVGGVLLLGVLSGLVAGPCVAAPLLALLIKIATLGNRLLGASMMFALAWGMGVVLIVAGAATGLLPKAGPWTEWVKRLFGFILLWAAVYFARPMIGESAYWLGSAAVVLAGAVFLGCLDALAPESGFGERLKRFVGWAALFAAAAMGVAGLTQRPTMMPVLPLSKTSPFARGEPAAIDPALGAGRPVLLDFIAEWCAYCKVLDRTSFADPSVLAELDRFRAFTVDVDDKRNRELVLRYDVPGPPLVVVVDSSGKRVRKLGYDEVRNTSEFLELLRKTP